MSEENFNTLRAFYDAIHRREYDDAVQYLHPEVELHSWACTEGTGPRLTLRACIHGGARTVGGSCVELACEGRRLVLDLGLPLDTDHTAPVSLPPVEGLRLPSNSLEGIVVSHAHPDHYGLLASLGTPVTSYGPADAYRMLEAAAGFGRVQPPPRWRPLEDRKPLQLGPFSLAPWPPQTSSAWRWQRN